MPTDRKARILAAFWHRSRRQFVEMTLADLSLKTGYTETEVRREILEINRAARLVDAGHDGTHSNRILHKLNVFGERMAQKFIEGPNAIPVNHRILTVRQA